MQISPQRDTPIRDSLQMGASHLRRENSDGQFDNLQTDASRRTQVRKAESRINMHLHVLHCCTTFSEKERLGRGAGGGGGGLCRFSNGIVDVNTRYYRL